MTGREHVWIQFLNADPICWFDQKFPQAGKCRFRLDPSDGFFIVESSELFQPVSITPPEDWLRPHMILIVGIPKFFRSLVSEDCIRKSDYQPRLGVCHVTPFITFGPVAVVITSGKNDETSGEMFLERSMNIFYWNGCAFQLSVRQGANVSRSMRNIRVDSSKHTIDIGRLNRIINQDMKVKTRFGRGLAIPEFNIGEYLYIRVALSELVFDTKRKIISIVISDTNYSDSQLLNLVT